MLDVHRLRLLREFAVRGSISGTAAALGFSASAVSQQLTVLEREAGAALLNRTARSATLTDSGRELAAHAERILAAVEAAEADLAARWGRPSGRVTVSAFPTAAVAFAPALAARLRAYPELNLLVRQGKRTGSLAELAAGDADVAVVDDWAGEFADGAPAGLTARLLCTDPLVVVVPRRARPAPGDGPLPITVLRERPWIAAPPDEPSRRAADRLLAEAGAAGPPRWEFEGLDTVLALVAQGNGVALVPRLALAGRRAGLAVRPLAGPSQSRAVYAVTRTATLRRPAVAVVLDALREAATTADDPDLAPG